MHGQQNLKKFMHLVILLRQPSLNFF